MGKAAPSLPLLEGTLPWGTVPAAGGPSFVCKNFCTGVFKTWALTGTFWEQGQAVRP